MIAEAIDTLITLGWTLAVWIVLTSAAAVLALYAIAVTVTTPIYVAATAMAQALAASRAARALEARPDRYRPPQRPAWARTDRAAA